MPYLRFMSNTTSPTVADLSILFRKPSKSESGCACCGKNTEEKFFVETEQGCYPVGPECFKKLKKANIMVHTAAEMGL